MEIKKLRVAEIAVGTYQRPLSTAHVRRIVNQFDYKLLGLPVISIRKDGSAFVVDGQHRLAALAQLGIKDVQCQILREENSTAEARLFIKVNTVKTRLNGVDKFFASVTANDPYALACQQVFESFGWVIVRHDSSSVKTRGSLSLRPNLQTLALFREYPAEIADSLSALAESFPADPDGVRSGEVAKALTNMTLIGGLVTVIKTWKDENVWGDELRKTLIESLKVAQLSDFTNPQIPQELGSASNARRLHGAAALAIAQRVAARSKKHGWRIKAKDLKTLSGDAIKRSFAAA